VLAYPGLVRRLSSDRILPAFLMKENSWRGTNHYIIVGYFLVSTSLVLILAGDVETLSGVYTYAFLGLMTLFGSGCMLLKFKRADIRRNVIAPWWSCILGVFMVLAGFLGNLLGDPTVLTYFALYFFAVLLVVFLMFERIFILRIALYIMQRICPSRNSRLSSSEDSSPTTGAKGGRTITRAIQTINTQPIFFFCKKPHLPTINKAILYVRQNEQTSNLIIVHVHDKESGIPGSFGEFMSIFDRIYPKLKIDFLAIEGTFGPSLIEYVCVKYKIPKNMMFIKQPNHDFTHTIAALGGVRIITG